MRREALLAGGSLRHAAALAIVGLLIAAAPAAAADYYVSLRRRIRGRVRRVALAPGRYRLRLVARDPARNASRERSARFTIVRR